MAGLGLARGSVHGFMAQSLLQWARVGRSDLCQHGGNRRKSGHKRWTKDCVCLDDGRTCVLHIPVGVLYQRAWKGLVFWRYGRIRRRSSGILVAYPESVAKHVTKESIDTSHLGLPTSHRSCVLGVEALGRGRVYVALVVGIFVVSYSRHAGPNDS